MDNAFDSSKYVTVPEATLEQPVMFNILRVENCSKSRINQIDEWKEHYDPMKVLVDRLHNKTALGKKPAREVIRDIALDDDGDVGAQAAAARGSENHVYKLLLCDRFNNLSYAFEYPDNLRFLRNTGQETGTPLKIPLGGRLLVQRGALIKYGVLMLHSAQCQYLGTSAEDSTLVELLNSGAVQKNIALLEDEVKKSKFYKA